MERLNEAKVESECASEMLEMRGRDVTHGFQINRKKKITMKKTLL